MLTDRAPVTTRPRSTWARVGRLVAACLPGLIGALVVGGAATSVTAPFRTDPFGPEGFMYFVAAGLLVGAVVTAVVSGSERRTGDHASSLGESTDADGPTILTQADMPLTDSVAAAQQAGDEHEEVLWWRFAGALVAAVGYLVLLPLLGYFVASFLYGLAACLVTGERSIRALATASLGTTLLFWLVFGQVLSIGLPGG